MRGIAWVSDRGIQEVTFDVNNVGYVDPDDEDEAEPRVREVSVEAMAARRPNAEDVQASRTMLVMHTSYSSI